jgi:hypothetical protein
MKRHSPVTGYNRQQRKTVADDFKTLAKQTWSAWENVPWKTEVAARPNAPKPLPGLYRFAKNNRYSVQFFKRQTEWGEVIHLIVRRHDEKPTRSWVDLQRLKNELVGKDRIAVEVFPAEADLIDDADLYHLWVLPAGFTLPFGLHKLGWKTRTKAN